MGWGAARKMGEVLDNTARVLAVEMVCAAQGVEFRAPLRPAPGTARAVEIIRTAVPPLTDDRPVSSDIETVAEMIEAGAFDELL